VTQEIDWHSDGWSGDHPINCSCNATHSQYHPQTPAHHIANQYLPNQTQLNKNVTVRAVATVSPGVNSITFETLTIPSVAITALMKKFCSLFMI
jgi:hypothetical protein